MVKYIKAEQFIYDELPTVYTNGNEESKVGVQRYGDNQERYYVMYHNIGSDTWNQIMEMSNSPKYYYNKQAAQKAAKRIIGLI